MRFGSLGLFAVAKVVLLNRKAILIMGSFVVGTAMLMSVLVKDLVVVTSSQMVDSTEFPLFYTLVENKTVVQGLDEKIDLKAHYGVKSPEEVFARFRKHVAYQQNGSGRLEISVRDYDEMFATSFLRELNAQIANEFVKMRSNPKNEIYAITPPEVSVQSALGLRIFGGGVLVLLEFFSLCCFFVFKESRRSRGQLL